MLSVFEQPWRAGIPTRALSPGITLTIRFTSGTTVPIQVIEATATEAIVQTSHQAEWRMVQIAPKELPFPPADTGGALSTYWIVRERVPVGAEATPP